MILAHANRSLMNKVWLVGHSAVPQTSLLTLCYLTCTNLNVGALDVSFGGALCFFYKGQILDFFRNCEGFKVSTYISAFNCSD